MSLTTNMASYIFFVGLIFLTVGRSKGPTCKLRKLLVLATICMIFLGTFLGLANGYNTSFVFRFTTPFAVFAFLLFSRELGQSVFYYRKIIGVIAFGFTVFVFTLTKLSMNEESIFFLRGWTLIFSTNNAIAIWHYFALAISASIVFDAIFIKSSKQKVTSLLFGITTIVLLSLITKTSAFTLAIIACLIPFFITFIQPRLITTLVLILGIGIAFDYMFFNFVSDRTIEFLWAKLAEDQGNVIRLVQIEYFQNHFLFFGHGFGSELGFDFNGLGNREISHKNFPYASELPILNVMHGGGIIATLWFILILKLVLSLMCYAAKMKNEMRSQSFFGYVMSLVLCGSISNPFLFSPVSMLMLIIALDAYEWTRFPDRDFGSS